MLKVILITIFGFILLAIGFGLCFLYLKNIENSTMALLLIPAFCTIILGIFVLIHAGNSEETLMPESNNTEDQIGNLTTKKLTLLEKNNALSQNWGNTVDKKDRLRLLQMTAAEEENSHIGD